jgi:aminoglycoside phosphotransferase (APT) family kinase protein
LNAPVTLHTDELPVDETLVAHLVADQLPEHARLPVRRLASSGSTNALFRLGDDLLVRLPRQPGGSESILKEARWLPLLGQALPVAVPQVVAVGEPSDGFPESWSVVRWVEGEHPRRVGPGPRAGIAQDLAAVVRALRAIDVPPEARTDPALRSYRAEPLTGIDADIRAYAQQSRVLPGLDLDVDAALEVWDEAMAVAARRPPAAGCWVHGDLLAENLLVRDGRLAAVLDFGGLAVGDPTVDLVGAWELLDPEARAEFRAEVDVDDDEWLLGRAWALAIALMTFPYYWATMPERCESRLAMARQVLMDAGQG